jgi:hypothetical protein
MSGNLTRVFVVMLAALFVAAFAYQASAISAGGNTPFTYAGKIVSLDSAAKVVTVQAGPGDELTFNLVDTGAIMTCNAPGSFTDLKIGDSVTVSYFDQGGSTYIVSELNHVPAGMSKC